MKDDKTKFITKLDLLEKEEIINMAKQLKDSTDEKLYKNYIYLLEFIRRNFLIKDITSLIGISHTVYSWMPRMLINCNIPFDITEENVCKIFKEIDNGNHEINFINKLKLFTNDSIIGVSKLLHFCNPAFYPIYDSNVYQAITQEKEQNYQNIDNPKNYIEYIIKLNILKNDIILIEGLKEILSQKKYDIDKLSSIRMIEFCLYNNGKNLDM
jgi:hypothetical protein